MSDQTTIALLEELLRSERARHKQTQRALAAAHHQLHAFATECRDGRGELLAQSLLLRPEQPVPPLRPHSEDAAPPFVLSERLVAGVFVAVVVVGLGVALFLLTRLGAGV
jgi:hypothetical protein